MERWEVESKSCSEPQLPQQKLTGLPGPGPVEISSNIFNRIPQTFSDLIRTMPSKSMSPRSFVYAVLEKSVSFMLFTEWRVTEWRVPVN